MFVEERVQPRSRCFVFLRTFGGAGSSMIRFEHPRIPYAFMHSDYWVKKPWLEPERFCVIGIAECKCAEPTELGTAFQSHKARDD